MERIKLIKCRRRISWGSVFAGVVVVLAISILLSILGSSIGLFMFDPQGNDPMSGIGTTAGIWTVVSLVISLGAGGFVAGKLAAIDGVIHGILVWSVTMIITVVLSVIITVGTIRFTADMLGAVSTVSGSFVSGISSAMGTNSDDLADRAKDIFCDLDFDETAPVEVRQDIRQVLKKSGVKEFQPEYLQKQYKGVRADLKRTVKRLIANPGDADKIINGFLYRLKSKSDRAFQDVNRNSLMIALTRKADLSEEEARRIADEYAEHLDAAKEQARETAVSLEQTIEQARKDWDQVKMKAKEVTTEAANAAARSALWSFIALLAGAILCTFSASFGARKALEGYDA